MRWFWLCLVAAILFGISLDAFIFGVIWPQWNIFFFGLGVICALGGFFSLKEALWYQR